MVKFPRVGPRAVDLAAAVIGFALLVAGIGRLSLEAALIVAGLTLLGASLWRPKTNG